MIRIPYGGGIGGVEHHSDSSEVFYTHTAGLGSSRRAARRRLHAAAAAIDCPDPVIFLEPKRQYWAKAPIARRLDTCSLTHAVVRRPGSGVTLISYGAMATTALEVAEAGARLGYDVEVIDLRTLAPFDDATVSESVRRTGRAIVVHEASGFCGYGAEVAARLTESCFHYLEAPILRVTGLDIPYPPPMLESHHLPSVDRVLDAIERLQWDDHVVLPDEMG